MELQPTIDKLIGGDADAWRAFLFNVDLAKKLAAIDAAAAVRESHQWQHGHPGLGAAQQGGIDPGFHRASPAINPRGNPQQGDLPQPR